ncbi:MAG: type 4a pilus biogenesis protein PilO [Desulfatibacillaceae bacterium]
MADTKKVSFAEFADRFSKLSQTQRILIYAGMVLLVVGAFVGLSFYPKYNSISESKAKLAELETELTMAKAKAKRYEALFQQVQQQQEVFEKAKRSLPSEAEIPGLLETIASAGRQAGLQFSVFDPQPEVSKEIYAEIPVSLTVRGPYHGLGRFFANVADLSRIVTIRGLSLSPSGGDEGGNWRTLIASCEAVTYRIIEAPGAANAKK